MLDAFYFAKLLDEKCEKNNLKIKESSMVHVSFQFVLLLITAVGHIKGFATPSFAKTGTCPLCPARPRLLHFPLCCHTNLYTQNCYNKT